MKKIKVKFLDSIAGLRDPRPTAELDAKYEQIRVSLVNRDKPATPRIVADAIAAAKKGDRYAEIANGFVRDFAFKSGEEAFISEGLAQKWEAAGIVTILPAEKAAA